MQSFTTALFRHSLNRRLWINSELWIYHHNNKCIYSEINKFTYINKRLFSGGIDSTFAKLLKKSRFKDAYDVLGIQSTDDSKLIKKAYLKKALLLHPDTKSADNAEEKENNKKNIDENDDFLLVAKAYEILSNPDSRSIYDMHLNGGSSFDQDFRGIRPDIYNSYKGASGSAGHDGFSGFGSQYTQNEYDEFGFPKSGSNNSASFHYNEDIHGERQAAKEAKGTAFEDLFGTKKNDEDKPPVLSIEWLHLIWKESKPTLFLVISMFFTIVYLEYTQESRNDKFAEIETYYYKQNELAENEGKRVIRRIDIYNIKPKD